MYARAWEAEYETPIFNNGRREPNIHNSSEIRMRHDLANEETCSNPGYILEGCPDLFPQTDEVVDGTDKDHNMEPGAEINSGQLSPTKANPRSNVHHTWNLEKC